MKMIQWTKSPSPAIEPPPVTNTVRVLPPYAIEDGVVMRKPTQPEPVAFIPDIYPELYPGLKTYQPANFATLPGELASIHDEKKVLKFVEKRGLLGYNRLARLQGDPEVSPDGDPLDWFFCHVKTVKMCLDLTKAIQDKDSEGVLAIPKQERRLFPT